MSKRNTVRINMEMLDGYLKAKNITPKEFCENQLGFSDGWYYGIRKKGGRGVKILVAQLIARKIGIDYMTLVVEDDGAGRKGNGNPSVNEVDSSLCTREPMKTGEVSLLDFAEMGGSIAEGTAGASPRPTEREEERGTGNPPPTGGTGENRKPDAIEIRFEDLIPIMLYDLHNPGLSIDFVNGYLTALGSIFKYNDIRKEMEKNARPE